jgi:hypothetical protein
MGLFSNHRVASKLGVTMYLDEIAKAIRSRVPSDRMPDENATDLFLIYASLVRAKGTDITDSDIHDAWAAWMAKRDPTHESLVPFDQLSPEIQSEDAPFGTAARSAAAEFRRTLPQQRHFLEVLFPSGLPKSEAESTVVLDLYKTMVESSESLVRRRQAVNTFFLTINGALLTASGIIIQSASDERLGALGISVLSLAGLILSGAWRSLIISFGQLNRGKFKVINTIEQHLKIAIYAAEWEALERGENPNVYRSFTSREIWVPNALFGIHGLTVLVSLLVATGCISVR